MELESALKLRHEQNRAWSHSGSLLGHASQRLYLVKLPFWIGFREREREIDALMAAPWRSIDDEASLGWRYTKHAIRYMDRVARAHHARFIIIPITPDRKHHFSILKRFAAEEGISFVDSSSIDRRDASLFLPGDGHFSENGARTMATLVAKALDQAPPPR